MRDAAVFMRVSSGEQEADNQEPGISRFCDHHDLCVVRRFVLVDDSAWADSGSPDYKAALKSALEAAWRGEFKVLVIWALDRLTRQGAEDALRLIRQFKERGVVVMSVQESWLNGSPEIVGCPRGVRWLGR
jgi:DNA invertase Pin-like site-specific DNA recombinase